MQWLSKECQPLALLLQEGTAERPWQVGTSRKGESATMLMMCAFI